MKTVPSLLDYLATSGTGRGKIAAARPLAARTRDPEELIGLAEREGVWPPTTVARARRWLRGETDAPTRHARPRTPVPSPMRDIEHRLAAVAMSAKDSADWCAAAQERLNANIEADHARHESIEQRLADLEGRVTALEAGRVPTSGPEVAGTINPDAPPANAGDAAVGGDTGGEAKPAAEPAAPSGRKASK